MADKGIIFSASMVRALLDGRKTQTRRLLTRSLPPPDADQVHSWFAPPDVPAMGIPNQWAQSGVWAKKAGREGYNRYCGPLPYRPGDRLYVREAWSHTGQGVWDIAAARMSGRSGVIYSADGKMPGASYWPSIHMPREFSRLWLSVTDVRVQRVAEISEADARAEGVVEWEPLFTGGERGFSARDSARDEIYNNAKSAFADLWNSLHTKPGERWGDNPWIVAVSFGVHYGNIDTNSARAIPVPRKGPDGSNVVRHDS